MIISFAWIGVFLSMLAFCGIIGFLAINSFYPYKKQTSLMPENKFEAHDLCSRASPRMADIELYQVVDTVNCIPNDDQYLLNVIIKGVH